MCRYPPAVEARVRSRGQSMWDLWWKKWQWDRFLSEYFGFPMSVSFHWCSITRKRTTNNNHHRHLQHRVAQEASKLRCVRSVCCGALHHLKKCAVILRITENTIIKRKEVTYTNPSLVMTLSCSPWGKSPYWVRASLLSRLHDHTRLDTPHTVGLLLTSDQPYAETCTWQHTTITTSRQPSPWQDANPQSQQPSGCRPTP
jgi:hypothetical protein